MTDSSASEEKLEVSAYAILKLIDDMHDKLTAEHNSLSGNWFGGPRKRHHQIIGASRALLELHQQISAFALASYRERLSQEIKERLLRGRPIQGANERSTQ